MIKKIDINADLGEGAGQDSLIMPLIASCNITCGGHYGNNDTMRAAIKLAKDHNVKVGAHPSYPDPDNFGRMKVSLSRNDLIASVYNQVSHFYQICESENIEMHHVKLHGALYNLASYDAFTADAVIDAIVALKSSPKLYAPYKSVLAKKAKKVIPIMYEAFIDRRYNDDRSLVSRSETNALIKDSKLAFNQLIRIIVNKRVETVSNKKIKLKADTFCIHGDQVNSMAILNYIHDQMKHYSLELA